MSADLLAEFGQGSAPAQSSSSEPQKTKQPQHSQINPLVDDFAQSDDIFFGGPSSSQPVQDHSLDSIPVSGHYKAQAPASRQQVPSLPAFNLPRQNNSDILFDAAEDTPASDTEDDWGDFEGPATNTIQPNQSEHSAPIAQDAPVSVQAPNPPNNQKATDTFNFFESLSIHGVTATAKTSPGSAEKNPSPQAINPSPNPNPTWDDDSFGDWGEFADAPSTTPNVPAPDSSPVSKIESASVRKSASNPKPPLKKKPTTARPAPQQPAWDDDAFDDWGDFNDGPDPTPAPTHTAQKSTSNSPSLGSFTSGNTTAPSTVRPTNIPPPSVLLELLVELMNNLQKEAAASSKTRQDPASQATTATKIHTTLSTAARIIAGRTLRWKRDMILSQSMRIGPARAGKSSGMKLSAVNKHEDVKEEQDAVDVLALWRERAALFNAVIQTAGLRPIPTVPTPSALKVTTAKQGQGALKATHACALCALKRDERVLRVDEENVQDSFGEWWTDHWGHTGCRLFWEENHKMLGQR